MGTGTPLLKVGDETFDGKTEPIIGTTLTFATPPAGSSGIILGADSGDEYARRPRFDSLDWLPSYAHRNCRVPRMILMTHSVRTKFPADFLANGSDCKHIKRRTMRLRNIYIIYIIYIYIYIFGRDLPNVTIFRWVWSPWFWMQSARKIIIPGACYLACYAVLLGAGI